MATGSGLRSRKVDYDNITIGDLVACVRYKDYFGFFSFSEIYNNKEFTDTKFVYNKDNKISFSSEVSSAVSSNPFLGITGSGFGGKKVNVKKTLYDIFYFDTFQPKVRKAKIKDKGKERETSESVFRYLNGIEPGALQGELEKDETPVEKEQVKMVNYLTSINIARANDSAIKNNMFILRVTQNGFIIPEDLKNLTSQLLRMRPDSFKNVSLKDNDLPRLSSLQLLQYIFSQEGRKDLSSGQLCYSIVPYEEKIALLSNIDISGDNLITNINENNFVGGFINFKKSCFPNNFRVNDIVIGIYEKGVYIINDRKKLLEEESNEKDYFQNYLDNYDSGDFKKKSIAGFRKFFRYPKKSLHLLIIRNSSDFSAFDTDSIRTFSEFSQGFYNTLSLAKAAGVNKEISISVLDKLKKEGDFQILVNFRNNLGLEFINFIKNNFLRNLRLTAKKDTSKKKLIEYIQRVNTELTGQKENLFKEEKDKEKKEGFFDYFKGKDKNEEIKKSDIVFIVTNLTGIKDQDKALVSFFSMPSILYGNANGQQYENLRLISYFVLCTKSEYCDRTVKDKRSVEDTQNVTFPFLLDQTERGDQQTYKMYFNEKLQVFTGNVPLIV